MKSFTYILLALLLWPLSGKTASLQETVAGFELFCSKHPDMKRLSSHYKEIQIFTKTFLQSTKEAGLDLNFTRGSSALEALVDDVRFHSALNACYPNSPDAHMRMIYYLIAADLGGKVVAGVALAETGAIITRLGARLVAYYGVNVVRLRMAMITSYLVGLVYKEYREYQKLLHPSKELKKVVDQQLTEADNTIDSEIKDMQELAKRHPNDPEIQKQLKVLLDLKVKFKVALQNS